MAHPSRLFFPALIYAAAACAPAADPDGSLDARERLASIRAQFPGAVPAASPGGHVTRALEGDITIADARGVGVDARLVGGRAGGIEVDGVLVAADGVVDVPTAR